MGGYRRTTVWHSFLLVLALPTLSFSNDLDTVEVVQVAWERTKHAAGFESAVGPYGGNPGCITPNPFGQQCTGHRVGLLAGCLVTDGCEALVCPDQAPYNRGNPKKKIEGAICQMRGPAAPVEQNHGMCRPGGCTHWFLKRGSAAQLFGKPGNPAPWYEQVPEMQSAVMAASTSSKRKALVVLPQRLLDFECHGANPNGQLAKKGPGQWCGPPGCVDMGVGGFTVVHQWTPADGGVVCLLERDL